MEQSLSMNNTKPAFDFVGDRLSDSATDAFARLLINLAENEQFELCEILDDEPSVADMIRVTVVRFSDRKHYQLQYRDPSTGLKKTKSSGIPRDDESPKAMRDAEASARNLEIELMAERVASGLPIASADVVNVELPHTKCCCCQNGARYVHVYPPHEITVKGKTYRVTVPCCYEAHSHHESLLSAMEWVRRTKRVSFTSVDPEYPCQDGAKLWERFSSFIRLCGPEQRVRAACRRLAPPWTRYYCAEDIKSHYSRIRLACFGCGRIATLKDHDGFIRVPKTYVGAGRRPNEGRIFCGTECQNTTKDLEYIRWLRKEQRSRMDETELARDDIRIAKRCLSQIAKFNKTRDRVALQSLLEELQPPGTSQMCAAQ